MTVLRYQVRLPRLSGLPEDDVVNVMHFDTDQTIAEDADDIAGRIIAFYAAIKGRLSNRLSGVVNIKAYEVPDPALPAVPLDYQVGAPVYQTSGSFSPGIGGGDPLPSEIAMCATLLATPGDGKPIEYRRGRLYIGPLDANSLDPGAGSDVPFNALTRDAVGNALKALAKGPDLGDGRLCVYSPTWHQGRGETSGGAPGGRGPKPPIPAHTLDEATEDVTVIRIDNAADIQRRRGFRATLRTDYAVV